MRSLKPQMQLVKPHVVGTRLNSNCSTAPLNVAKLKIGGGSAGKFTRWRRRPKTKEKYRWWHNFSVARTYSFNSTKTFEMIQKFYSESAVHCATVFHWYNVFSEGRESICDEQRSGRPMTTKTRKNIARVADILKEDCQSPCRLIAERMEMLKPIVQKNLLEDLQKWKLCAQFVPHAY